MESLGTAGAPRKRLRIIVPNLWKGEWPCLVGPFSGRIVAEYFANAVVDFGRYETIRERIFARQDSFYVEVARQKKVEAVGNLVDALGDLT